MKRFADLKWLPVLLVACLCFLFPTEARADAIDMGFVAMAGAVVLVPLIAFEVFVEAVFLAIGLKVRYHKVLLLSLGANLASLAAGIPVKIFNAWMYFAILPREMAPYFRQYPRAVFLGTAIYFVVTLLVEFLIVFRWCRKRTTGISPRRVALVVFLANAATYSVLAPLHYVATRPIHDIREFADDSRWAQRPVTRIYYVEQDSGNLCSISTDGQGKQILIPDTVKDYQFRSDRGWFLYRNGSNSLCLLGERKGKSRVCWKTDQRFRMEQVACDPDGMVVAYLSLVGDLKPFELVLWDVGSGRVVRTGIRTHEDNYEPEVAWSDSPDILFLKDLGKVQAYRVRKDTSVVPAELEPLDKNLLVVYGRFKNMGYGWGGNDWGASFSHDVSGGKDAMAYYGLDSHLCVKTDGGSTCVVADNPGLLHLPSRGFDDVCFIGNGNELVFDDYQDIYLLDVAQRKVGWITHGSKVVTATARYQRKISAAKK
jgi:hypothetical protein